METSDSSMNEAANCLAAECMRRGGGPLQEFAEGCLIETYHVFVFPLSEEGKYTAVICQRIAEKTAKKCLEEAEKTASESSIREAIQELKSKTYRAGLVQRDAHDANIMQLGGRLVWIDLAEFVRNLPQSMTWKNFNLANKDRSEVFVE